MIIPKQIQQTIKCPKSIMETLEQDVKYVKVNNKDFFVIFEHTSHLVLVFEYVLFTWNVESRLTHFSPVLYSWKQFHWLVRHAN